MISGGIKFFDKSLCLGVDGSTIVATSGLPSAQYVIDRNADTYWRSSGSSDAITETLTISLPVSTSISRFLALDINWKDFDVMYDVAGTWTHFAAVVGMDGSKTNITETAFVDSSAYYEFTPVTTSSIRIRINKSQVVNAEKFAAQAIVTTELGTLVGFPKIDSVQSTRNARVSQTSSGRFIVQKSVETLSVALTFANYPRKPTYSIDFDVVMALQDRENPFLVWLCGGRRGTKYFSYALRGFRLQDCIQVQVTMPLKLSYSNGVYQAGLNTALHLEEHI